MPRAPHSLASPPATARRRAAHERREAAPRGIGTQEINPVYPGGLIYYTYFLTFTLDSLFLVVTIAMSNILSPPPPLNTHTHTHTPPPQTHTHTHTHTCLHARTHTYAHNPL